MNVIGGAVDDDRRGLHSADDASQVGEQIVTEPRRNQSPSLLGAEDQVNNDVAGSVCHFSFAPLGLFVLKASLPTACAVGCNLAPLRGWVTLTLRPGMDIIRSGSNWM